eukprot:SAG31_NODE_5_length_43735_cov_42.922266_36_plen_96_part_00
MIQMIELWHYFLGPLAVEKGPSPRKCGLRFVCALSGQSIDGQNLSVHHCLQILKEFDFYHLSSGDELRRHRLEGTAVGLAADEYIKRGDLVRMPE